MKRYQITPERKAHLYALMAWSDQYIKEQAEEIAYTTEYSQLNNLTYAEDSITTAFDGVAQMFSAERLVSPESSPKDWDKVIKILIKIHNKWVRTNAKNMIEEMKKNQTKTYFNIYRQL